MAASRDSGSLKGLYLNLEVMLSPEGEEPCLASRKTRGCRKWEGVFQAQGTACTEAWRQGEEGAFEDMHVGCSGCSCTGEAAGGDEDQAGCVNSAWAAELSVAFCRRVMAMAAPWQQCGGGEARGRDL